MTPDRSQSGSPPGGDLSSLLQQAFAHWPEEARAAAELCEKIVAAADAFGGRGSAGRGSAGTGSAGTGSAGTGSAELTAWLASLGELSTLAATDRSVVLARGMRLLAGVEARRPAPKPRRRSAPAPSVTEQGEAPAEAPATDRLTSLRGCGPKTAERLGARGIHEVRDLLGLLPLHYEDRREVTPIRSLEEGRPACCVGLVTRTRWLGRGRRRFFELVVVDGEDELLCRWFRTYPGLSKQFVEGMQVWVSGTPKPWKARMQMAHPVVRALSEDGGGGGGGAAEGIVPRYPAVEGVGGTVIRSLCAQACERATELEPEPLPQAVLEALGLPGRVEALRQLHCPAEDLSADEVDALENRRSPAHQRLTFDELFLLQLGLAWRRRQVQGLAARPCPVDEELSARLSEAFPFALTGAQRRVIAEIASDLGRTEPMQRLVQGDVGSGKTAVAFAAAAQVMASGGQVALMAPTEILAAQHHETLAPWMERLGYRLALLTASTPRGARESCLALLAAGQLQLVVGTHALIAERVAFERLSLVVVDEQHRFGVAQRARLRDKGDTGEHSPHLLVMTATPIPRTLALTAYGDLDSSVIDELPAGRTTAKTHVFTARQRGGLYRRVKALLAEGKRAFVVCPLVEESEKLLLADAERTHTELTGVLAPHPVGLLHGRMSADDKADTLAAFRSGALQVLVATTVVEVGVDIPDADLMVVESAQRFGLAQLHQLRGRVGRRAGAEALCLLLVDPGATREARQRLQVMESTADGFRIAEEDLKIRGPGELLGIRQAGDSVLTLSQAVANPRLLSTAREVARRLLDEDPALDHPRHGAARQLLETRWQGRLFGEETG
ncbi:MAG: ATP-dependent DNA helicase RecG [bacterium]